MNPIRRSFVTFAVTSAGLVLPVEFLDHEAATLFLVSIGWLAAVIMVFSLPVFLLSVTEYLWTLASRRLNPSIEELDLSLRARSLLRRYGFHTIASIDRTSDEALLVLSNFDPRSVREVRRAISLWKYRRWQDAGFPVDGY